MTHKNYIDLAFVLAAFCFLMLPYYLDLIDNGEHKSVMAIIMILASR